MHKRKIDENQKHDKIKTKGESNMEIKAYVVEEQGNEQITDHFKVKEFACKDGTPIVFVDDYLAVILEIARKKQNRRKLTEDKNMIR